MKDVNIGILGAGNVGRGLIELISRDGDLIAERTGVRLKVARVMDRSYEKKAEALRGIPASADADAVLSDPSISIVVELLGGLKPAGDYIRAALQAGKSVVSANKALIASPEGPELLKLAEQKNVNFGFEAAVAGAIPVIRTLRTHAVSGEVKSIRGILNGTCNFMITRMEEDGLDYDAALKLAQQRGFAEADPAFDVSGQDAAQKLAILAGIMLDSYVPSDRLRVEGITAIRPVDLKIAQRMGWVIRLLAVARRTPQGDLLRVHPAMIHRNHMLASVKEETNAVFVDSTTTGPLLLIGKGAGAHPTATAVLSDLIDLGRGGEVRPALFQKVEPAVRSDFTYRFYVRVQTQDRPGVLAEIATLLADHNISIASFHQEEGPEPVQLVIVTHEASEEAMVDAMQQIDLLRVVMGSSVMIRIEDM